MTWSLVVAVGVATYAIRLLPMALIGRRPLSPLARRALSLVPPAILSAIVVPGVVLPEGDLMVSAANPRLVAAIVAGFVAWRTQSVVLTLGIGMGVLWALTALLV